MLLSCASSTSMAINYFLYMEEKLCKVKIGCSVLMYQKPNQLKETTHFKIEIWKLVKTLTQITLLLMQNLASPLGNSQNMMQTKKRTTLISKISFKYVVKSGL